MTLTRADVAHLKAGDEVTARFRAAFDDDEYTVTGQAHVNTAAGWLGVGSDVIRYRSGGPSIYLVDVVSPKPPVLRMDEPTWPGAVVMSAPYLATRCPGSPEVEPDDDEIWLRDGTWYAWEDLPNPRPLTDAERREYGIPETVPPGHVAVDARDFSAAALMEWSTYDDTDQISAALRAVADAEIARRKACAE